MPPLLAALHAQNSAQCVESVKRILHEDFEAARFPFWEHDVDPPLCCAIRLGCDAEVVRLLLDNGADVHSTDKEGHTPLSMLRMRRRNRMKFALTIEFFSIAQLQCDDASRRRDSIIEDLLLQAGGCDDWSQKLMKGSNQQISDIAPTACGADLKGFEFESPPNVIPSEWADFEREWFGLWKGPWSTPFGA
jgi:hypothetical protein